MKEGSPGEYLNLLVISSFLISNSVVDWDTSRFVPAPSAIWQPLFIADILGWLNDDVSEEMTFEEDRAYLEHAIGKLDASSENPGRIEYLLRTSFERQFLEMSLCTVEPLYKNPRYKNTLLKTSIFLRDSEVPKWYLVVKFSRYKNTLLKTSVYSYKF
jgi:hypothetical protein